MFDQLLMMWCGLPCGHSTASYNELLIQNMVAVAASVGTASGALIGFRWFFKRKASAAAK